MELAYRGINLDLPLDTCLGDNKMGLHRMLVYIWGALKLRNEYIPPAFIAQEQIWLEEIFDYFRDWLHFHLMTEPHFNCEMIDMLEFRPGPIPIRLRTEGTLLRIRGAALPGADTDPGDIQASLDFHEWMDTPALKLSSVTDRLAWSSHWFDRLPMDTMAAIIPGLDIITMFHLAEVSLTLQKATADSRDAQLIQFREAHETEATVELHNKPSYLETKARVDAIQRPHPNDEDDSGYDSDGRYRPARFSNGRIHYPGYGFKTRAELVKLFWAETAMPSMDNTQRFRQTTHDIPNTAMAAVILARWERVRPGAASAHRESLKHMSDPHGNRRYPGYPTTVLHRGYR